MFVIEEASCCLLVDVTSGCKFMSPTGGGEKGSPPPKSTGFINDNRGYFGGRGIAHLPSSSHIRDGPLPQLRGPSEEEGLAPLPSSSQRW